MKEIWKDVKGYEGLYKISNLGNIKTISRIITQLSSHGTIMNRQIKSRLLTPTDNGNGYLLIGLVKNKKRKNYYIHRLVAEHFISTIPEGYTVNHKDFNKNNNTVRNLEIITLQENITHAYVNGRFDVEKIYKNRYENITEETKDKIVDLYNFMTLDETAKEIKICRWFVSKVLDERGVDKNKNTNKYSKEYIARKQMLLHYRQTGQSSQTSYLHG